MKRRIFNRSIGEIGIAFPKFEITKETAEIWYRYSKDLSDGEWERKIGQCIKYCNHIPTLADILNVERIYKIEQFFRA